MVVARKLYWPFQFTDYMWFFLSVSFKLYLFGKYTGLAFGSMRLVFVTVGSVLIVSCWALLLPRWGRLWTLWGLNLLLSFIIFADVVYYRYFSDFITIPVIMQAGQVGAISGSVMSLIAWKDLMFALDLLLAVPVFIWLRKRTALSGSKLPVRIVAGVLACALGCCLMLLPINNYKAKYGENLFINNWWNTSIYNVTGLFGFHYMDTVKFVNNRILNKNRMTDEQIELVRTALEERREGRSQSPLFGSQSGNNVMIIQLEAFQNFMIGKSINGKEITPNLNRLANEIAYYDNFYHQVGQGRTVDAEFVVNNSLYPIQTGAVYREYPDGDYDSLPKVLKAQGYSSYAFHVFEKTFWNRHIMYQQYGLDYFYGLGDFEPGESVGWGAGSLGDESLLQQMVNTLLAKPEPFYAMAVALSSHHPYNYIPQKYKVLDVGDLNGTLEGDYLHAVHYVDYAVGQLVDRLKSEGLWDNTILVIYGDHDGALGQQEKYGELLGFHVDELTSLEFRHEVPLFLHIPGAERPGTHSEAVGMIDITPTVLELLGITLEDKFYLGENLLTKQNPLVIFRNGSFTDGRVFYRSNYDGILSNGVCYDTSTRTAIDIKACEAGFTEMNADLKLSDQIIHNKLLKRFKK